MQKRITWLFGLILWSAWGLALATTEMPQGLGGGFNAARHAIEKQGEEHIARNHRNKQRIAFRDGGIAVSPLAVDPNHDPGWTWGMRLMGYGTPEDIKAIATAQRHVVGTRLEYRHGPITEWYENKPAGLEQGFTLRQPPMAGAADLVLVLALQGGLSPAWEIPGKSVRFHTPAGDYALTYRDLKVIDARGDSLPARLAIGPDRLEIHLDAHDAAWPIIVDPLVVNQQAKLNASDGASGDNFGASSVALSDDTALVGAPYDVDDVNLNYGAAYVFIRSGGTWSQQAKLTAEGDWWFLCDRFGWSVALSGDTALVGCSTDSAYIFTRTDGTWSLQARLDADYKRFVDDRFSYSVALSDDTALVGAVDAQGNVGGSGAAYVFTRSGGTWSQQAKLIAADGDMSDAFGWSVALSGDSAVIGAKGDRVEGTYSGSAYVFTRSGGTWSQQAKLTASDGADFDQFGCSVALSDDTTLVGNNRGDGNDTNSGAAYVFTRSGGTWSQQAKLIASDGNGFDLFGDSVALSGNTALVGAWANDDSGHSSGSAYIFTRSGSTWSQQAKLTAADSAADDFFGHSVALSGDTALVGAPFDDDNGTDSGSAYVFALADNDDNGITNWVSIQGNVRTVDGIPVCALVLANGQYMFSCDGNGAYRLNVPLDDQGQVTLFAFADGFAPYRVTAAPAGLPTVVQTRTADPGSPLIAMTPDMACAGNNWVHLSGAIESFEGDPLCALVLANGQHMFSCGASQGRYDRTVPVDENGNITLFGFADGFQPYSEIFVAPNCEP
jgi:hypothetical protein